MISPATRLSIKTKLLYGVGDIGNAAVNSAVTFYLLVFYTDAALIPPALAGTALLIGKIWDAVNDPLFGWITDRTSSRFGRRRVYMLFGALPLMLTIFLLWFVPPGATTGGQFLWIVLSFILFDTLMTVTSVPYYALTAELTADYDERASLTAFRMVLGVPAYIIGAAMTPALVNLFAGTQDALAIRMGYGWVGVIYGVIAAVTLLIAALGLRENAPKDEPPSKLKPLEAIGITLRNRYFVRLIVAYLIANLGFVLIQTLLVYFLTYQMKMGDQVALVMLLLLLSVLVFLFPWKMIADRWNKGPAYGLGLAIGALSVGMTFFLPDHPSPLIYGIVILAGMGFSTNWVFPWAMVPDVIEYDQVQTGEQRSGMYYGVWGFTSKLTTALGTALAGWMLQLSGYIPNVAQSDMTLLAIRWFFGPLPALIILCALPLLFHYPITRQSHALVRAQIAACRGVEHDGVSSLR